MQIRAFVFVIYVASTFDVAAQTSGGEEPDDWSRPFPAVHIVGNLYYVGTFDLSSYLITTPEGHILVNTGAKSSVPLIRSNIESLGFSFDDIEILLATHGHRDHVGGMAEIKRLAGARMLMHEADVPMLEDGGNSDYRFPEGRGQVFEPVVVDQPLNDGDSVRLGDVELTVHHHPGHTKGSTSFSFVTEDSGRAYRVLIVNMGTINPDRVQLLNSPAYPNVVQEFTRTFEKQKQLVGTFDVWVSSHASHFFLHDKYSPGDAYDPDRFVDPDRYLRRVERTEQFFLEQLRRERQEQ